MTRQGHQGLYEKISLMFRKVRQDLSGKLETSRPITSSVQFEPVKVSILFFQLS